MWTAHGTPIHSGSALESPVSNGRGPAPRAACGRAGRVQRFHPSPTAYPQRARKPSPPFSTGEAGAVEGAGGGAGQGEGQEGPPEGAGGRRGDEGREQTAGRQIPKKQGGKGRKEGGGPQRPGF